MVKALKKWWGSLSKEKRKGKIISIIIAAVMSAAAIVMWVLSPNIAFLNDSVNAAAAVGAAGVGEKIVGTLFYFLVFIGFTMLLRMILFVLFIGVGKKPLTIVKLISSAIKYGM